MMNNLSGESTQFPLTEGTSQMNMLITLGETTDSSIAKDLLTTKQTGMETPNLIVL